MKTYILNQIKKQLTENGFSSSVVNQSIKIASGKYETTCNTKDLYKIYCDAAGQNAQNLQSDVKYQSPKVKSARRAKRPQEAFNFNEDEL